jgi:DNA repair photolyase
VEALHQAGIRTYVMIAPLLPGAEGLPEILAGKTDYVIIDRMNYHHADWVYRKYNLRDKMTDEYFSQAEGEIRQGLARYGIPCR